MKKLLRKIGFFFPILVLSIAVSPKMYAAAASATWSLLTNQTSTVSGAVTSDVMNISTMQGTAYGSSFGTAPNNTTGWMRVGTTAGFQLPNGYSVNAYVDFTIAPTANNNLTVTSVQANLLGGGTGGDWIAAYYSLSNFSATPGTNLGTATYNGTAGKSTTTSSGLNLTNTSSGTNLVEGLTVFAPNISVASGQTLKIRFYCWNAGSTTKYLAIKNVSISGTTTPWSVFTLTSAGGTNAQTTCVNSPITDITYSLSDATGASFSGLPSGVTGSYSGGTVTISGTPTVAGTYNYTVTPTGGAGSNTATGSITVNALTAAPVITPVLIYEGDVSVSGTSTEADGTNITVYKNGTTSIGTTTVTGGAWTATVTALILDDVITAKATASGKCESVASNSATAASNHLPTIGITAGSNMQTISAGTAIETIVYKWGGTATSAATVWSGSSEFVPDGMSEVSDDGVSTFTIAGTPTTAGTYHYLINSTDGSLTSSDMTGTITVKLATPNVSLGANAPTNAGFTARWAAVAGVTSYTVKVYLLGVEVVTARQTGVTGTSVAITGLASNTTYTYTVEAVGDGLLVPNSNVSAVSGEIKTLNTAKAITAFSIAGQHYALLDEGTKTITVYIPAGTSKGALTTSITVSPYANVNPAAGSQDFTNPVTYTVTAEDLSTVDYTVTVFNGSGTSDHFRTKSTGNWSSYSTWESSSDNLNWINASIAPDSVATSVQILHNISVDVAASAKLVTIPSGKTLTVNANQSLKIVDDATASTDLNLEGYLLNRGAVTLGGGAVMSVSGTYEHNVNGGTIPSGTWQTGSLCLVTGITSSTITSGFSQNFYDFTFNCTANTGNFNLGMSNNTIANNVNILSSGSGAGTVALSSAAAAIGTNTITIGGNLNINETSTNVFGAHRSGSASTTTQLTINILGNLNLTQGVLDLQIANGITNNIWNVQGNFNFTGGTFKGSNAGGTLHFSKGSGTQTYTKSGGTYSGSNATIVVDNGSTLDLSNQLVDGAAPFTAAAGATLKTTLATGINGNLTTTGTKTLNAGANYVFNGAVAQVSGALVTAAGSITVENAAGLTLSNNTTASSLTINSGAVLNVSAGKQLTVSTALSNNGTLNLLSSASGNGTLLTPATLTGSGTYNVQQYLTGAANVTTSNPNGRFWYVSSPVSGATSSVFSPTAEAGNRMWSFNETSGAYTQITDGLTTLAVAKGYVTRMNSATPTVTFTGTPNNGEVVMNVTRNGASSTRGFDIVGNPYPSYLDWKNAVKTDMWPSAWFRSATPAGDAMVFDTYNASTDAATGNGVRGVVNQYIPPMQGFWVKALRDGVTGHVTLNNALRSHQSSNLLRSAELNAEKSLVRLQVSNGSNIDQAVLVFMDGATDALDAYDSEKMFNNVASIPEIYTMAGTGKVAINGMAPFSGTKSMMLGFNTATAGTFSIQAKDITNLEGQVTLIDNLLKVSQNMIENPIYEFNSDVVTASDRFTILIERVATGLTNAQKASAVAFGTTNGGIQVETSGLSNKPVSIAVYSISGQLLHSKTTQASTSILNTKLNPGMYLVNISAEGFATTQKVIIQ